MLYTNILKNASLNTSAELVQKDWAKWDSEHKDLNKKLVADFTVNHALAASSVTHHNLAAAYHMDQAKFITANGGSKERAEIHKDAAEAHNKAAKASYIKSPDAEDLSMQARKATIQAL